MSFFKIKNKKLLALLIVVYIFVILSLTIPISSYSMDLPGNITPINKEIKIEGKNTNNEFYSVYVMSFNKPTLFQVLIGKLSNKIDVYKDKGKSSSSDFFRGALLEELSYQYAIINAYTKASLINNEITIDYELESYVISYTVNPNIPLGTRFTHVNEISINDLTLEELTNMFSNNNELKLTVIDSINDDFKELEIFKTDGKFGIIYDKYFKIKETNPKYKTFYEKDNKVGPSGGLLQTLEIYTTLTGLKTGKKIAGTGTISPNGDVGPIGLISQKIFTVNKKVDIFLVPEYHYEEALKAYKKIKNPSFVLIKVSDFDEAISKLFP